MKVLFNILFGVNVKRYGNKIACRLSSTGSFEGVNKHANRSHTCGELREEHEGLFVTLCGWLEFKRMDSFASLRDPYGTTQCIIPPKEVKLREILKDASLESVVSVNGEVLKRPEGQANKKMKTGEIEVLVNDLKVLNVASKQLPFSIRNFNKASEVVRMKSRYLDLRFAEMQNVLRIRSKMLFKMREWLIRRRGFVEVETPTLFRKTPGGAQEFIVPTTKPGEFYSLVQSPQQLKQLLMVGGTDRYMQVARCYRDETTRPDRQPEFTQLDLEMSFTDSEGVMRITEETLTHSWPKTLPTTFPVMSHCEALKGYGTDKPDLSIEEKIYSLDKCLGQEDGVGQWQEANGLRLLKFSRGMVQIDSKRGLRSKATEVRKALFPETKMWVLEAPESQDALEKALAKSRIPLSVLDVLTTSVTPGDTLIFTLGEKNSASGLLGKVRDLAGVRREGFFPLWVIDFPLVVPGEVAGTFQSAHHPFTAPHPQDLHLLPDHPLQVRGLHYDLVMNGWEVGGGSVRIHSAVLQEQILKLLGIPNTSLGHILEALSSGAPPHAGIALGVDRLVALATGKKSIREVIAFPKGAEGRDHLSGAPAPVPKEDLERYHLRPVRSE